MALPCCCLVPCGPPALPGAACCRAPGGEWAAGPGPGRVQPGWWPLSWPPLPALLLCTCMCSSAAAAGGAATVRLVARCAPHSGRLCTGPGALGRAQGACCALLLQEVLACRELLVQLGLTAYAWAAPPAPAVDSQTAMALCREQLRQLGEDHVQAEVLPLCHHGLLLQEAQLRALQPILVAALPSHERVVARQLGTLLARLARLGAAPLVACSGCPCCWRAWTPACRQRRRRLRSVRWLSWPAAGCSSSSCRDLLRSCRRRRRRPCCLPTSCPSMPRSLCRPRRPRRRRALHLRAGARSSLADLATVISMRRAAAPGATASSAMTSPWELVPSPGAASASHFLPATATPQHPAQPVAAEAAWAGPAVLIQVPLPLPQSVLAPGAEEGWVPPPLPWPPAVGWEALPAPVDAPEPAGSGGHLPLLEAEDPGLLISWRAQCEAVGGNYTLL